jgi:hypothetical protein
VLPDGRFFVAGSNGEDFLLTAYRPDGSLDTDFGAGGFVTTDFAGGPDWVVTLLPLSDGRILAVGPAVGGTDGVVRVALARYQTSVPGPATADDNVRFVTDLYRDLLGRAPDADGLAAHLAGLETARRQALAATARAFVASAEYQSQQIAAYYRTFLGREASPAEVAAWLPVSLREAPESVLAAVLASDEYTRNAGATEAAWLDALYGDLLGRARTAGETAFLAALDQGATPAQVASAVLHSAESWARRIEAVYATWLDRRPGPEEVAAWQPLLAHPNAGGTLLAAVIGSPESFAAGGTTQAWLDRLYARLLGRQPDAAGYQTHLFGLLAAFQGPRRTVAETLTNSPEYRRAWVARAYSQYLGRPAGPEEVALWADRLDAGTTQEQVLAAILTSDEFVQKDSLFQEEGADGRWLYRTSRETVVWLRDPAYRDFLDCLQTGQCTRQEVAAAILGGAEYRARLVREDHRDMLGRAATEAEVSIYLNTFGDGARHEQFLADLLGGAEYFLRAGRND